MEQILTRRERERQMRRQAMLAAARAVFAERGYANATLDEVAQRAEFGKGTLYNYFEGGKEEILFAIFDDLYGDFCRLIEEAFDPARTQGRSFRDVFHGFVLSCFTFFCEHRDQFLLMVKEAQRLAFSEDRHKAAFFQQQSERIVGALVTHLEAAMERGEIRRLPAVPIAHMIFGNIKGYHMHLAMPTCHGGSEKPVSVTAEAAAALITTIMLDGLLARPNVTPPTQPTRSHETRI